MEKLDVLLAEAKTVGIAGHINPDGDCVGSCLAMYNYIKEYFPQIDVNLYLEPIPNIFKFMKRSEEIKNECDGEQVFDLFIALDCGDESRLGESRKYLEAAKHTICIDHHISNKSYGEHNYVVPEASSACELVFDLISYDRITKEIAECLYTGMVHDTGVFRYSCTSRKTMEVAGKLMELGINYPKIVDETFFTKTYNQNQIFGLALLKSKLHLDGRMISCIITKQEMDQYGVLAKHLDGIASQILNTKDVEASALFYELEEGVFKVSMRSKEIVDVSAIAVKYSGGGHVRAAGFSMEGDPEKNLEIVIQEVEKQF